MLFTNGIAPLGDTSGEDLLALVNSFVEHVISEEKLMPNKRCIDDEFKKISDELFDLP